MRVICHIYLRDGSPTYLGLRFPEPVKIPRHQHFRLLWGCQEVAVNAVARLTPELYEVHLGQALELPMFEGGKYESYPDAWTEKIHLAYDGALRLEPDGKPYEGNLEFVVAL